jgi:hypothetical protein
MRAGGMNSSMVRLVALQASAFRVVAVSDYVDALTVSQVWAIDGSTRRMLLSTPLDRSRDSILSMIFERVSIVGQKLLGRDFIVVAKVFTFIDD